MPAKQVVSNSLTYGASNVPSALIYAAHVLKIRMLTIEEPGDMDPVYKSGVKTVIGLTEILTEFYPLLGEGETGLWTSFISERLLPLVGHPGGVPTAPLPMETLGAIDYHLSYREYMVGGSVGPCDFLLYQILSTFPEGILRRYSSIRRYLALLPTHSFYKPCHVFIEQASKKRKEQEANEEQNTHELPGAVMGEVVTRFPPEPSGYLHVGHAKAALLNEYFARKYNGRFHFRFDDTNPVKEKDDFMESIKKDLDALGVKPDTSSYTSDHFEEILNMCTRLIREGKAYCDDTPADQMSEYRKNLEPTPCRSNTVEQNLEMWDEMQKGTEHGLATCVRAKIDIKSEVGCLRDPVIYRCLNKPHLKTGDKYKVYPTYDFACPIVDSIEGITHGLRTVEFTDRDAGYRWVCEALGIRTPWMGYFSRLNMRYTLMSKRNLQWFVDRGLVEGWDDPRFPTVQGIRRRGMSIQALKEFVVLQGLNKNTNFMEWGKLWAINRNIIDDVSPRYSAIITERCCVLNLKGVSAKEATVTLHRNKAEMGVKHIPITDKVLIEHSDATPLHEGEMLTLMNVGNVVIHNIVKEGEDVVSADAELLADNNDFKSTRKLTWVPQDNKLTVPVVLKYFGNLITVPQPKKGQDLEEIVNHNSMHAFNARCEKCVEAVKLGSTIQIERTGFFYYDHDDEVDGEIVRVFHHTPDGKDVAMRDSV